MTEPVSKVDVKLRDVVRYLERAAINTDTDPYWKAATILRPELGDYGDVVWRLPGKMATGFIPGTPTDEEKP